MWGEHQRRERKGGGEVSEGHGTDMGNSPILFLSLVASMWKVYWLTPASAMSSIHCVKREEGVSWTYV